MRVKIKLSSTWFLKHYPFIISSLVMLILIFVFIFLYKNFYQTIIHAEAVSQLRVQVVQRKIEINLFSEVMEKINERKKIKTIDWISFKDPFLGY